MGPKILTNPASPSSLFLHCSTLFQSRVGVGHAADNGPIVNDYSLWQPISAAWLWTAANDNMFTAAGGGGAGGAFTHTGKVMW